LTSRGHPPGTRQTLRRRALLETLTVTGSAVTGSGAALTNRRHSARAMTCTLVLTSAPIKSATPRNTARSAAEHRIFIHWFFIEGTVYPMRGPGRMPRVGLIYALMKRDADRYPLAKAHGGGVWLCVCLADPARFCRCNCRDCRHLAPRDVRAPAPRRAPQPSPSPPRSDIGTPRRLHECAEPVRDARRKRSALVFRTDLNGLYGAPLWDTRRRGNLPSIRGVRPFAGNASDAETRSCNTWGAS
jgi:hypothetical protein